MKQATLLNPLSWLISLFVFTIVTYIDHQSFHQCNRSDLVRIYRNNYTATGLTKCHPYVLRNVTSSSALDSTIHTQVTSTSNLPKKQTQHTTSVSNPKKHDREVQAKGPDTNIMHFEVETQTNTGGGETPPKPCLDPTRSLPRDHTTTNDHVHGRSRTNRPAGTQQPQHNSNTTPESTTPEPTRWTEPTLKVHTSITLAHSLNSNHSSASLN